MPTLTATHKEALWLAATTATGDQVSTQSAGTPYEKVAPFVASMLLTSADLIITTSQSGGTLSPVAVGTFIINKTAGFTALSDNQKVQCFGALLNLATSGAQLAGVLGASAAAEVGSAGTATPAVAAVSIPMLIASSAALALSASATHQQCGPLVSQFFSARQTEAFQVYMQFNQFVGNPVP